MIELGIPFSDPLADGPTVQYASNIAIENGITLEKIFHMIREVRKNSQIPLVLMGYINPILRYGVEKFCRDAAEAGADGLIIRSEERRVGKECRSWWSVERYRESE